MKRIEQNFWDADEMEKLDVNRGEGRGHDMYARQ
jgi:hypothetical protein